MGKKRQRKDAVGLDPEEAAALDEEDEFAKELAAAREIVREQQLLGGGGSDDDEEEEEDGEEAGAGGAKKAQPREFINNAVRRGRWAASASSSHGFSRATSISPPSIHQSRSPKPHTHLASRFPSKQNGLRQALEEIQAVNGPRPWPETMDVCAFPLELADVHDDIQREVRGREEKREG